MKWAYIGRFVVIQIDLHSYSCLLLIHILISYNHDHPIKLFVYINIYFTVLLYFLNLLFNIFHKVICNQVYLN